MSKHVVARANIVVFAVLIAVLALIVGVLWERSSATSDARAWVRHTYEVIDAIKDLNLAVHDVEAGQLGYMVTGDTAALAPYDAALGQVTLLHGRLQHLTADNAVQQGRLRSLAPMLQRKLEMLAQTVQLKRDGRDDAAQKLLTANPSSALGRDIEAALSAMAGEEQTLLAERLALARDRSDLVLWLVGALSVVGGGTLLWAARMLNQALLRSARAEEEQRTLALRLRTSLDSLSQGIAVFDADRRLTHWNDCFRVLLELPPALVRPRTPYAALYEHFAAGPEPLLESEDQVLHGRGRPGEVVAFERRRSDGHELEIRRTAMPDGGLVLTISDMTKRAEAEAVLRESQKMQAIGQLTGGIAHDFNNLLTIVLGNLDFIRSKPNDERLPARLERAIWAAQRGAALTRQLLAFARKQPLAPAAIDLAATVPGLVPLLRRTLGEHIDVRYVETAGLWPAMADPAQLESAVLNLALNARDAMPGGGRLTIELSNKVLDAEYARRHSEVKTGDYTMLAVSDTGHGMTPEVMARVFEPFFTTKLDGKGTGLGLAMVFGFVKQSGGHVKVYSEPGEGTTVRLYLPRAVGVLAAPGQRDLSSPVELPRGSATVLVVEDEPAVREIAVVILQDLGYRVLQATDGEEGLLTFGAHAAEVDLLLTDVVLPGRVRGRELAERITELRPEVMVLFMSGYTENSIVHNGRLDDGVRLISKPFEREQFARKVAEVLAARPVPAAQDDKVVELKSRRAE